MYVISNRDMERAREYIGLAMDGLRGRTDLRSSEKLRMMGRLLKRLNAKRPFLASDMQRAGRSPRKEDTI